MHHDYTGYAHDADDRSDVPDEIEIEICVECGVDRARGVYLEKRIAIGRCLHDRLGTDIAAGTRPVLNDKWLAEPFRKPLTHQARENVGRPTGGKTDDDAHQARRIGLRPSEARHRWQRGTAHGQMQKLPAVAKFHLHPPKKLSGASARPLGSGPILPAPVGWRNGGCRLMAHSGLQGMSAPSPLMGVGGSAGHACEAT